MTRQSDLTAERNSVGVRLVKLLSLIVQLPSLVLIALVRVYQLTLSPIIGQQCRFQPTCSHYMIEAIRKYGAIRGAWKGTLRICRCHPWHPGGHDPP